MSLDIFWRVLIDLSSRSIFFLVNILAAKTLSVGDFGKFIYALSLAQIFYSATEMGLHLQLIKDMNGRIETCRAKWMRYFELKIVLICLTLLIFTPISLALWKWESRWLAVASIFWMLSNSISDFIQSSCNGLKELGLAARLSFIQRGMMFLGVLIAMLLEATLEGFIVALAGGGVLGAAISSRMLLKELKIRPVVKLEVREWRLILRNSLPMGFSSVLGQFWVRMGALLLGIYWSSRIVGEYGAAFRVFETTYFLPGAIMGVGMYYLSSAFHQDSQKFDIELRRVFKMILFCALILSGSVFMASPWIIGTLFGQAYTESVPVLKLFAVAINFVFLNYLGSHLMVILGLQRRHVLNVLIAFALAMVLLLQLANSHAALGAATAFLVTEAGLLLLTIIALWKKIRLQSRPFFKAEDKDILAFGER